MNIKVICMRENKKLNRIIQEIADEEGMTVEEIIKYMDEAIEKTYNLCNPEYVKLFGYKKPTIEEFLEIINTEIKKRNIN